MNSHFNYELDERQIRLILLDSEKNYTEEAWENYNTSQFSKITKRTTPILEYLPKINIGVNRSIIIPVTFIICIGSLSALLFSFIDFRKKTTEIQEESLTPTIKPAKLPITKTNTITTKDSLLNQNFKSVNVADLLLIEVIRKTDTTKEAKAKPASSLAIEKPKEIEKTTAVKNPQSELKKETKKKEEHPIKKKKKKRKTITSEEIPTINTTNNLVEPTIEPELKIN